MLACVVQYDEGMANEPSQVGYPEHLGRILVCDAKGKLLLRAKSLVEAAGLWSTKPDEYQVKRRVGTGTYADPTALVEVPAAALRDALRDAGEVAP